VEFYKFPTQLVTRNATGHCQLSTVNYGRYTYKPSQPVA
jgi:hypothetical protein